MSIEEVWEKLKDYITEGDVDKFKETLTSLSAEDRLGVLCMRSFLTDQGETVFSIQKKMVIHYYTQQQKEVMQRQ